ncbi:MAG: flagellar type III secretion system pore protein FliP [Defluviitaleaceae bacterium]|nr:flagellar type III secretion system pore protein FliP [Defluviitaleaceae bacterium]
MKNFRTISGLIFLLVFAFCFGTVALGAEIIPTESAAPAVGINIGIGDNPDGVVGTLQLLFLLATITIIPTLLIMLTSFTRIIIVLHFARSALGTQQMPPSQVLLGLALFLTLFIMGPALTTINETAIQPYSAGIINQAEALENAMAPLRDFMMRQASVRDVALFANLSGEVFATRYDVPNSVLIPAFLLGEITKGFQIGFYIFLPFIVIDMIVASTLMAMGMMMLPPAMISLPFKILIFVLADGWSLLLEGLIRGFR